MAEHVKPDTFHNFISAKSAFFYLQVWVHHGNDVSIGISGVINPLCDSEHIDCAGGELHTYTTQSKQLNPVVQESWKKLHSKKLLIQTIDFIEG